MRVLVVYGTSRGGTAGLAEMIAAALGRHGLETTIAPATAIKSLDGYDAVVVGGALYSNRWHPDALGFVHRFHQALLDREVWFFSSGPLDDSARSGSLAPVPQVRELARVTDVRGHMTFGGMLDKQPSSRLVALLSYGPAGDWRDPQQVEQWVERIATQLGQPRAAIVLPDAALLHDAKPAGRFETDDEAEGGIARIRRLLTLDDIDDDVGLDVFS